MILGLRLCPPAIDEIGSDSLSGDVETELFWFIVQKPFSLVLLPELLTLLCRPSLEEFRLAAPNNWNSDALMGQPEQNGQKSDLISQPEILVFPGQLSKAVVVEHPSMRWYHK